MLERAKSLRKDTNRNPFRSTNSQGRSFRQNYCGRHFVYPISLEQQRVTGNNRQRDIHHLDDLVTSFGADSKNEVVSPAGICATTPENIIDEDRPSSGISLFSGVPETKIMSLDFTDDTGQSFLAIDRAAEVVSRKETNDRIAELKSMADDEGVKISTESENDLGSFLDSVGYTQRPYLALLDNGNLRAVWKNVDGGQIGLQFRGCNEVHYVFFALRPPGRFMARAAGRDTIPGIKRQINAHDLWRLLGR